MMKILIFIALTAINAMPANAQNKASLLQRMNEIKNQSDVYFWDQYTCPDANTSKIEATKRLLLGINVERDESSVLSVEEMMPHAEYIFIDRGKLKQYFVYIKKNDAALLMPGDIAAPTLPSSNNKVINGSSSAPVFTPSLPQKEFVPDAFVQRIMDTRNFTDIYKLLKSLQAQGQILQFGKLKDVEDYSSLDLILFDMQSQEIITMLSSAINESGMRLNVVNGAEDTLDNYPTKLTAVIWYIKK